MNAMKMASAIVRFRLLRSIGTFSPGKQAGTYTFDIDDEAAEPIANGVPESTIGLTVHDVISGFKEELSLLCDHQTDMSR